MMVAGWVASRPPPRRGGVLCILIACSLLADGDEQLVAAIGSGLITVTDAAAILHLPKEQQREAVAKVRSGKFRTLQHAVEPPPRRATSRSEHHYNQLHPPGR